MEPFETKPASIIPFPKRHASAADDTESVLIDQTISTALAACTHLGYKVEHAITELERTVMRLSVALYESPRGPTPENVMKLAEIKGQLAIARRMIDSLRTGNLMNHSKE